MNNFSRALEILRDIHDCLDALAADEENPFDPLPAYADDAEAREAAPQRWAVQRLDEVIKLLSGRA